MSRKKRQQPKHKVVVDDGKAIITQDAYSNLAANLGVNSNNLSNMGKYIMSRMTWDYNTLNVLFRNNWIAKAIIEKPANEMIKNGFEIQSQITPDKISKIMQVWQRTKTNEKFLDCLKWSRLFGGCVLIPMLKGQDDLSKPLDYDTIMPGSYKGCFFIDRWSGISPTGEIVKDIEDSEFGQPETYIVCDATTGKTFTIHHSRIIKMIGRKLPYWEEIAENYWGASEIEHVYDELKKRDDTSANISFLIFLANIRVFKMAGLAQMLTLNDQDSAQQVFDTMARMNQLMCNTGTLAMDQEDDFTMQQYTFAGINDIYESFMLDISGAAEIPVDKLFGRSPSGFNSGEEVLQNYYDTIQEKQETYVRAPLEKLLRIITMSTIGKIPNDMEIIFNPVRRSSNTEKTDLASKTTEAVLAAFSAGIIGKSVALKELKQTTNMTGLWSNITDDMINDAAEEDKEKKKENADNMNNLKNAANKIMNEGGNNNAKEQENKNPGQGNKDD